MATSHKTAISFQNLHIYVKMTKVSHDASIELNQLCKDSKERIKYRKYCPHCDKEITGNDIIKGYQYAENRYVTLNQDELESIKSDQDKNLTVQYFCKPSEISDILLDRCYYLTPEIESEKDYSMFRKAMSANRVVAICEIVIGNQMELVALFPTKMEIIAFILFYENEINECPVIMQHKTSKDDMDVLKSDITKKTRTFDWSSHFDKYQLRLRKLITDKIPKSAK